MNGLIYLLQVNLYLLIFYLFYLALLKNETFFKLNRSYLIASAILSLLIPLFQSEWIRSFFVPEPVYQVAQTLTTIVVADTSTAKTPAGWSITDSLWLFYLLGGCLFLLRFLLQLILLSKSLKGPKNNQAFSFFHKILVDEGFENSDTILKHENVHVKQWHSADILFFELLAILNWFNPVSYAYKKSIKHIHEFIADESASQNEASKAAYAHLLVSRAFGIPSLQLTNSFFNESLLKRRIYMLHKKRSRQAAILKYGLSAPLFIAMIIFSSATLMKDGTLTEIAKQTEPAVLKTVKTSAEIPNPAAAQSGVVEKNLRNVTGGARQSQKLSITSPANTLKVRQQDTTLLSFAEIDVLPQFPGGQDGWSAYVSKNLRYPEEARNKNIYGRVTVRFVVEKDGSISNIKVLRGIGGGCDEEAIRLLQASPRWKPGKDNGKPVRVSYIMPIAFKLSQPTAPPPPPAQPVPPPPVPVQKDALFILNGKEISYEEMKAIPYYKIESVHVWKDEEAVKKYGEKGKKGVMEIRTKKEQ